MEDDRLVYKVQKSVELKGTLEKFFEFMRIRGYGIMAFEILEKHPDGRVKVDVKTLKPGERDVIVQKFIEEKLNM